MFLGIRKDEGKLSRPFPTGIIFLMTTEELVEEITSRNPQKVWRSACKIISEGQDRSRISPLIEHLPAIVEKTKGLKLGGAFAPNQRFVDFAIRTIEFHRDSSDCTCELFTEHGVDPKKEVEKDNVLINETERIDDRWITYYLLNCKKCEQKFKVEEGESHYRWWSWDKAP